MKEACPFCSNDGELLHVRTNGGGAWVHCHDCGADGPYITENDSKCSKEENAIKAWNKRNNNCKRCKQSK